MSIVYLGFGSNLGDRAENILQAVQSLKANGLIIHRLSSIIETDPVGGPAQGKFLNAVCKIGTSLSPEALLAVIHKIEKGLGRTRTIRNGPRTIDIDILLFDRLSVNTARLAIPHPKMLERDFVLRPLTEIAPELVLQLTSSSTRHESHRNKKESPHARHR